MRGLSHKSRNASVNSVSAIRASVRRRHGRKYLQDSWRKLYAYAHVGKTCCPIPATVLFHLTLPVYDIWSLFTLSSRKGVLSLIRWFWALSLGL
jgi:hypothetical protein